MKYAQHLTEHLHAFGDVHDIMQIIEFQKKRYSSQHNRTIPYTKEAAVNNHINDDHMISTNKIFDTILKGFQEENQ